MNRTTACFASLLSGLGLAVVCSGAEPVPDAACPEFDEFSQVYEYTDRTADVSAGACPNSTLTGSPAYPERRVQVRIEYRRGEYFVAQETREWDTEPQASGCILITPRLVREYRMYRGRKKEWAYYAPDRAERSQDDRPPDHNSLIAGTAKARQPRPTKVEATPFGVNCGRIDSSNAGNLFPGGSLCEVYLPKKCTSELYMAPIDFTVLTPVFGPMRGRTTSLALGDEAGVDPSAWSIP